MKQSSDVEKRQRTAVLVIAAAVVGAFVSVAPGICQQTAADAELPQPLTAEHFRELKASSPFTRVLDLSESLMLTGVARLNGKPMATLMDRQSKETFVISEVPNPKGWKLIEITGGGAADLETVSATISVSGEMVSVRYDGRQLNPSESTPEGAGGADHRPPSTEAEKKAFGQMVYKKWTALDKEQQEQAKKIMEHKIKENPKMSDRQKGETLVGILDHVSSDRGKEQRERDSGRR